MDGMTQSLGQRIVQSARLAIEVQIQQVLDDVEAARKRVAVHGADRVGGADPSPPAGMARDADAALGEPVRHGAEPLAPIGLSGRTALIDRVIRQCRGRLPA